MRRSLITFSTLVAFGLVPVSAGASSITTSGGDFVQSFGKENTQTYGQTLVALDGLLDSFSFWLGPTSTNFPDPSNPSLTIMAYVYAWDDVNNQAVGSALYTSSAFTHNATPDSPFTQYIFLTGGVPVTPGDDYVLFLSTSGLAGTGQIQWEADVSDSYAGGNFVFLNNGEDLTAWTTSTWASGFVPDLHFGADFSPSAVPEPATLLLLGAGLGAVAARRRLKKRA